MQKISAAVVIFLLAFLFLQDSILAEEIILKAEVDKNNLTVGSFLTYKLTVSSSLVNTPKPKFPDFKGLNILSRTNSSKLSITKGKVEASQVYIIVLAPVNPGVFTFKPAELKIGDKTYSSAELKIEVQSSKPGTAVPGKEKFPKNRSFDSQPQSETTL